MLKKITPLILLVFLTIGLNAQTFVQEDFSTFTDSILPPVGSAWKNVDSTANLNGQVWRFDDPDNRLAGAQNTLIDTAFAIIDSDWYGTGNFQKTTLSSPTFNPGNATVVKLEFDHAHIPFGSDTALVEVFDGTSWTTVADYSTIAHGTAASPIPVHESIDISAQVVGKSSAQVRFYFHGSYDYYWMVDNVEIFQPTPDDIKLISIDSLKASCGLTSTESIIVTFTNAGSNAINRVPLNYSINGGAVVAETYNGNVLPNDTIQYTFTTTADFSVIGSYSITAYSSYRGDINLANDTVRGTAIQKNSIATFPYFENFENGSGGWTSGGTNNSWALGAPASSVINSAYSGTQAWVTNLNGAYNNNEESYVISPCFDLTNIAAPQFKARIWIENETSWDGTVLQASVDGGISWQKVGSFGDPNNWYNDNTIGGLTNLEPSQEGWSSTGGSWVLAEHDLTGLGGQPSVELRFAHGTDGSVIEDGFAFDDVLIQDAPALDAGIVAIVQPVTSCGLGANDSVKIAVSNFGSSVINNLNVAYSLNGGTAANGTISGPINPGDTVIYTFNQTVNLSAIGNYTIQSYSSLVGDNNVTNDTITAIFENIAVISQFPYNEGFENGTGGWTTSGANSSWAHGTPSASYITSAATGSFSWVTNLSGDYNNNELSYLESPCFDLSTYTVDPTIYFSHMFNTESCCDEGWLEVSIDGGQTWNKVTASPSAVNWYNDLSNQWWDGNHAAGSGVWQTTSNQLTGAAGSTSVKVRFVFSSDGSIINEGFGIDNFSIIPPSASDAGVVSIIKPTDGCALGNSDSVSVNITNAGTTAMSNVTISYQLNGGTTVTQTIAGPINSGDTIPFTFNTTVNLSTFGSYNLVVYVTLANDLNQINDTIRSTFQNIPLVSTLPYSEGFESGPGGWTTYGANSSWSHGTPAASYITSAAAGTGAWVTNLLGDYNNNELAYLESPCFDFSTYTVDPIISFSHIFNTESCCDEGWVELSTNAGQTWSKLIAAPNAINWYNDITNEWWDGDHAAGSGIWHIASNQLTGVAGNSSVKIRFVFSSDGSVTNDGFGVDNFNIAPPSPDDAAIVSMVSPTSGCGFGASDSVRVRFANTGVNAFNTIDLSYSVNGGAFVTETYNGTVLSGDTLVYTFNTTVNLSNPGNYSFTLSCDLVGDGNVINDSLRNINILNSLQTLPYNENFDILASGQSGAFANGWEGTSSSPNYQWLSNIGGTTSGATGPIGDATTGSTTYMYTEASSPAALGDTAILTSPCVDLTNNSGNLTLLYNYHMYGADIQTLFVDIDSAGTWVNVDTIVGQKQSANADPYQFKIIPISQFSSLSELRVRFWTVRGNSYDGDVAIDDVRITDIPVGLESRSVANDYAIFPNPSNGQFTLLLNNTSQFERIEMKDVTGKLVYDYNLNTSTNRLEIDLNHLEKGVYILNVIGEHSIQSEKIIIQ